MTRVGGSLRSRITRLIAALMLSATPATALLLGACGGAPTALQQDDGLPTDQAMKLSTYYHFTNDFDLIALKQDYAALAAAKAKAGDTLYINSGRLEAGLEDLARARGADNALGGLDAAADRALQALRPLVARAKGLNSYFTMRGYLSDDYARAHREDAAMIASYDSAIAAFAPFATAVEQATARQETVLLKRMQAERRMNDYYDILIVRQTRAIRAVTATPTALDTPVAAAHVDRLFAELAATLDRDRAAWAAAMVRMPADQRPPGDSDVIPVTEQMIGAYRQLRRNGDADDYARFREISGSVLQAGG